MPVGQPMGVGGQGQEVAGREQEKSELGVSAFWIVEEYQLPRKHIQGLEKAPKPGKKK